MTTTSTSAASTTGAPELAAILERWEPVIGLEIHVQLRTNTKMFCRCRLSFGDEPNTNTCPVCLAHPGVLPVPNARAIEYAMRIGLALGCSIAPRTIFHRKNYFYPDNPKAYQISQYDNPICIDGEVVVGFEDDPAGQLRVGITRAHMEEDAAKLTHHSASGRIDDSAHSWVDFNRGGTPLVEIVTEPDIHSPEEAKRFLTLLRSTLLTLGVSDCNMEEGSLRCDANVSIRPRGTDGLGTKTELKNMNSFRFLERGVQAEIIRQAGLLDAGEKVEQQTLHFDPANGTLRPLRSKEEAHDYRYFPEPDLVPIVISEAQVEEVRAALPELPAARMARFREQYGLSSYDAEVLNGSQTLADQYESVVGLTSDADPKIVANWVMGDVQALLKDGLAISPGQIAALVDLVARDEISGTVAKDLLTRIAGTDDDPTQIVADEGLAQVNDDSELQAAIDAVLGESEAQLAQYRSGKTAVAGYFVGQVMKRMQGRANPKMVRELLDASLPPVDES